MAHSLVQRRRPLWRRWCGAGRDSPELVHPWTGRRAARASTPIVDGRSCDRGRGGERGGGDSARGLERAREISVSDARLLSLADPQARDPVSLMGREWLVTNGLGGFAAGTVAGIPTRRHHGPPGAA